MPSFESSSIHNATCLDTLNMMGIRKASVLPLPVSAFMNTFFFSRTRGMPVAWMGVGVEMLWVSGKSSVYLRIIAQS